MTGARVAVLVGSFVPVEVLAVAYHSSERIVLSLVQDGQRRTVVVTLAGYRAIKAECVTF
jgi:hypothetical protein